MRYGRACLSSLPRKPSSHKKASGLSRRAQSVEFAVLNLYWMHAKCLDCLHRLTQPSKSSSSKKQTHMFYFRKHSLISYAQHGNHSQLMQAQHTHTHTQFLRQNPKHTTTTADTACPDAQAFGGLEKTLCPCGTAVLDCLACRESPTATKRPLG